MARMHQQALRGRWADEIKRLSAAGDQAGVAELVDYIKSHVDMIGVFDAYWQRTITSASVRGLPFEIDRSHALRLYRQQDGCCALSGLPISFRPRGGKASWKSSSDASLDRIDTRHGYVIGNVWWLHRDVNRMKADLPLGRMLELCRLIGGRDEAGQITGPERYEPVLSAPADVPAPVLSVVWFLRERVEDDPLHKETAAALWQSYLDWCRVGGTVPRSQTAFGRALRSLGYENTRGHTVTWLGLRIRAREGERV